MKYIHYGSEKFDINRWDPIQNISSIKPSGGLWGSLPLEHTEKTIFSWKDWCIGNDFQIDRLNISFEFMLADTAHILDIDNVKILKNLPIVAGMEFITTMYMLDFESLAEEYDAIRFWISKDFQLYWDLYGWDVDSVLVLNPDIII